ncbi:MAG: hypothetical protein OEW11_05185 [Nitrospirota bacterium]|nr:hypothetical protein [Nitrospirota bacterium]
MMQTRTRPEDGAATRITPLLLTGLMLLAVLPWSSPVAAAEAPAPGDSTSETLLLKARDPKSGNLLYTGLQTITRDGTQVVEKVVYHAPDGSTLIHEREGAYNAATLAVIRYQEQDLRLGQREEVRVQGNNLLVTFVKQNGERPKTATLARSAEQFMSLAIPALIRKQWDRLAAGGTVGFDLIVPSRTGTVGFKLSRIGEQTLNGQAATVIRMEPSSWLIRKLVDPMDFVLGRDAPHALLAFHGRGVVPTASGDPLVVNVSYETPPAP